MYISLIQKPKQPSKCKQLRKKLLSFTDLYRYFFISHKPTKSNKYTLLYQLVLIQLLDTILSILLIINIITYFSEENGIFIEFIFAFVPFPLVTFISPLMGLVFMTSQSYGIVKSYLIYNYLSILELLFCFIAEVFAPSIPKLFPIFKLIHLIIKIIISYLGTQIISLTSKLNQLSNKKK